MSNLAYKLEESYTYADYLSWDDDERYELIDGVPYMMAAPTVAHQRILTELLGTIWNFLEGKPCEVFAAPFDVRLFPEEDNNDTTVVQPDIVVICDPLKLSDGKACKGAPDLVIEILSDSSVIMDRKVKAEIYLEAGVKEYWIVSAKDLEILVNVLTGDRYISTVYRDRVPSTVLPGLEDRKEQSLEPDITVVCDPSKFDGRYYKGVPAMIVEVASPSTVSRDFERKKEIYEKIGVNEYWVVMDHHNVYVYLLKNGKYEQTFYSIEEGSLTVPVASFPGLEITLDEAEITKFASWYKT